jgi:hypothetical protein
MHAAGKRGGLTPCDEESDGEEVLEDFHQMNTELTRARGDGSSPHQ